MEAIRNNIAIYSYLLANVLDYFFSKNFAGMKIDSDYILGNDFDWLDKLKVIGEPIYINMGCALSKSVYKNIFNSIALCHNNGIPSTEIIDHLRNKITGRADGKIEDLYKFNDSFNDSVKDYDYLTSHLPNIKDDSVQASSGDEVQRQKVFTPNTNK